jgi:hypothetical protein
MENSYNIYNKERVDSDHFLPREGKFVKSGVAIGGPKTIWLPPVRTSKTATSKAATLAEF